MHLQDDTNIAYFKIYLQNIYTFFKSINILKYDLLRNEK